ncbi:hypothetical protein G7062_08820 [Erysipelothrix sp. HDW6C]|uniref:MepB family protein n=1 Tax=Erysipelothrix sp. HDW6C TaxID=2714930 RepID=UPI00140C7E46|nr:MepB family protein [Erysipelothrix sp. HDW6C]QIK70394.1 hypothetical protein G7062_08820 [Erysipelothrix sp. HDW6C]
MNYKLENCVDDEYNDGHTGLYKDRVVVVVRDGTVTPKKQGVFVKLWKRDGKNIPYAFTDIFDFLLITVAEGCFIIPKSALLEHGFITSTSRPGKMGFRVYRPVEVLTAPQAIKTQQWQAKYFVSNDATTTTIDQMFGIV